MDIYISQNNGVPVYRQIINQIKQLISVKRLTVDQELPAIRALAEQLLINPNTVARAYRDLENAGWVYKKRGSGTFVSEQSSPLSLTERQRIIDEKITSLLVEAKQMNMTTNYLIERITRLKTEGKTDE